MNLILIASGDYFSSYGGGQIYVANIVRSFVAQGLSAPVVSVSHVPCLKSPEISEQECDGVRVWSIRFAQDNEAQPLELSSQLLKAFEQIFSQARPSLVHAHGWKAASALTARKLNIPCIITAHHGGIVCPNGLLMNDRDALCTLSVSEANCLSCASAFVPGGKFWRTLVKRTPAPLRLGLAKSLKRIRNIPYVSPAWCVPLGIAHKLAQIEAMQQADSLVAPSRAIAQALRKNGFSESRVRVIPHGITPLQPKPLLPGYPGRALRLGYVGRIAYIKGLHIVLAAMKQLPEPSSVELHVYGEAVTRDEKVYAKQLQDSALGIQVHWHGKIAHQEIDNAYLAIDVLLLTSICTEIFGLTLLEALSSGRPVIASRCGGPEDIVEDGVNGFLVPANDPKALAEVIQRFIDGPGLLEKLAAGIKPVNTLTAHVQDLIGLYQEVLEQGVEVKQ